MIVKKVVKTVGAVNTKKLLVILLLVIYDVTIR